VALRDLSLESPDLGIAATATRATAHEEVLPGYLDAARRIIAAAAASPPLDALRDPLMDPRLERIRWYPLPEEALVACRRNIQAGSRGYDPAMRFAIGIPTVREYGDPGLLVELGRSAEEAGWDGVFLWDHLVYGWGDAVADPWTTLAVLAARTERIRLGVCMTVLARRRPAKVARETATLDVLSGGRTVFGASLGSLGQEEFAAFGEDPDPRVRAEKVDEALDVIAGLWSGGPFSYRGRHNVVEETVFLPRPVQRPRIPIWIGGRWPSRRPFQRAARWDGVFPTHRDVGFNDLMPIAELRRIVDYTRSLRDDPGLPLDVIVEGTSPADAEAAADVVAPYEDAGLTWWVERTGWFRGPVDEMRARVEAGPPKI
jgi:alkanesulfonate monooxygenase SsuD/methylene tetrahydromethanopterin reductase-like flavin-dependent oxidoreductase (luciferase family)